MTTYILTGYDCSYHRSRFVNHYCLYCFTNIGVRHCHSVGAGRQVVGYRASLAIAPQVSIRRSTAQSTDSSTTVIISLAGFMIYIHDGKHQAVRVANRDAGNILTAISIRYRYGVTAGREVCSHRCRSVLVHLSGAPYKIVRRYSSAGRGRCLAIHTAGTVRILQVTECNGDSVAGLIDSHNSGGYTAVGIDDHRGISTRAQAGDGLIRRAVAPHERVGLRAALWLNRGRTIGAAVATYVRAAFYESRQFGRLSKRYARSGFAAAGVRYCYRVGNSCTQARSRGRRNAIAPRVSVRRGAARSVHRGRAIGCAVAAYVHAGDNLRQYRRRLANDYRLHRFTTARVRYRHRVRAGRKARGCDAHLAVAPQVAVRRRAATGAYRGRAVVGLRTRLFRYIQYRKLQPARVFYRNALHCLAAVRVRYRYGVAARAQPAGRGSCHVHLYHAVAPRKVIRGSTATGCHRGRAVGVAAAVGIRYIVYVYCYLGRLFYHHRPEYRFAAVRVRYRHVVVAGAQPVRVFYVRGVVPVVAIRRCAANYRQLDAAVGFAVAAGVSRHTIG